MVGIDAFDDTCPPQRFETTHMRADESVGIALDALDLGPRRFQMLAWSVDAAALGCAALEP